MGHDIHFLRRLERVSALPQVEFALSLYRDSSLVRHVLERARAPEGAERVALSLGDPVRGPFAIVTRAGRFVTCLGEGMQHDLPVIPRARIAAIVEQAEGVRQRLKEKERELGPGGGLRALLRRVLTAGHELTREEFAAVAAWQPVIASELLRLRAELATELADHWAWLESLTRKGIAPQHREALGVFWEELHAVGHLTALSVLDERSGFEWLAGEVPEAKALVSWPAVRYNLAPVALRGAWAVARLGKLVLPDYKRRYHEAQSPLSLYDGAMGLAAIGLRHRKLRAEVHKALPRAPLPAGHFFAPLVNPYLAAIPPTLVEILERPDAMQEVARLAGQEWCVQLGAGLPPGAPHRYEQPADVPPALALTMAANLPGLFVGGADTAMLMLACLSFVARVPAEELYPPGDFWAAVRIPARPEDARAVLDRLCWLYAADVPKRATKSPGRNEPCPCGSGKKYKRCCGVGPPVPGAG